jgi:hypothetical protein
MVDLKANLACGDVSSVKRSEACLYGTGRIVPPEWRRTWGTETATRLVLDGNRDAISIDVHPSFW